LLILQHYFDNSFIIQKISASDDTVLLASILELLRRYKASGEEGLLRIDARNAGTVMRFLIPLLSVTQGHFLLTGNERMKQRPVAALVDAMRENGAEIEYVESVGFPPLLIRGRKIQGSRIRLDASLSSQFITALLLLAPTLDEGLTIELIRDPVSWPYVRMTVGLLEEMGVQVVIQRNSIKVFPARLIRTSVSVEVDWSGASFWYMMLALADKGEIFLSGLIKTGIQGDEQAASWFEELGVETIETNEGLILKKNAKVTSDFFADFTDHPDIALPVIMTCALLGNGSSFKGLERLRIKESDRLEAVREGLLHAGVSLKEESQGMWRLSGRLTDPSKIIIDNHGDHRVAMAFSALAMKGFTVCMEHPEVVNKSYPGFWNDLENAGFTVSSSC
jgi:3-phosphoshikimate 1-carboxyvinyltransferase